MQLTIAFFKPTGIIGNLIKWQTRGKYSHVGLTFSFDPYDAINIESKEGKGVRRIESKAYSLNADLYRVSGITPEQVERVYNFAFDQVGKKYDWSSVFRFVSRRQASRRSSGVWFCSELVFAALAEAGIRLFINTEPWEVSPGMLCRSPKITLTNSIFRINEYHNY